MSVTVFCFCIIVPVGLNAAFNINRFVSGDLVDEHGAAAVAH